MTAAGRQRIRVTGVVQGVGFRPFVHALAGRCDLAGFVRNDAAGVTVEVEGSRAELDRFATLLTTTTPPLARIDTLETTEIPVDGTPGFHIEASRPDPGRPAAIIPPDTAVCDDCTRELFDPADRRHRHPFITCTNCGPRYTIITALPYDRPQTTMAGFEPCAACAAEYANPRDRRHHAQPIACPDCGPTLRHESGDDTIVGTDDALGAAHRDLAAGRVIAVKGLGGYHLAVDATSDQAVERLRRRKARVDKPFAVMVPDLGSARALAHIDTTEADALTGPARPIVLLRARENSPISSLVAPANPLVGVLLPYTPVHHLLFAPVPGAGPPPTALVMTSGNRTDEPICFDDADARERLSPIADTFLTHDRPIRLPVDDSVVRIVAGAELPIRRSRGYAPLPVPLPTHCAPTLAVGGEIKNTFALATGPTAWLSQHLGDMGDLATLQAFDATVETLLDLYGVRIEKVAVDTHPGYRTRARGRRLASELGLPDPVDVQHHHAHLSSLLAEHGHDGRPPAIGFVFDGTGHGTDDTLWGGEVLIGGHADVERWGHLAPVLLPGGESAISNPCRTALAHLRAAGIDWDDDLAPVAACADEERRVLAVQLSRSTGCVESSSMGRLFDACASLLDLRHRITYEAQAAIDLEMLAAGADGPSIPLTFHLGPTGTIDPTPLLHELVRHIRTDTDRASLARGIHHALVDVMAEIAVRLRDERSLEIVGLTGGVFQNALLTELATDRLRGLGFEVLTHRIVPPNDGGLALGQVMVAAHHAAAGPTTIDLTEEDQPLCV